MDGPSFLLFVRTVLPVSVPKPPSGGACEGRWSGKTRNLLQSLPWLCKMVVRSLAGPPHHPNRSGRDWPYKSPTRREPPFHGREQELGW